MLVIGVPTRIDEAYINRAMKFFRCWEGEIFCPLTTRRSTGSAGMCLRCCHHRRGPRANLYGPAESED